MDGGTSVLSAIFGLKVSFFSRFTVLPVHNIFCIICMSYHYSKQLKSWADNSNFSHSHNSKKQDFLP